jgi:uncharacterized protein
MRCLAFVALTALATGAVHAAEPVLSGPLKEARAAAEKGDFSTALKILRIEADKGSAEAANRLGESLLSGRGGKPDPAEAARWFQKAADASHPAAMLNLARLLDAGAPGVAKDGEKARFLVRAAAEAGDAAAQARLGGLMEADAERTDKTRDFAEAREWYEKAAAKGDAAAFLALARFHDRGIAGLVRNPIKATELILQAAKGGSSVAMNEMGLRYQKGMGMPMDNVAAVGWFMLAAQHQLPAALVNLGDCYESGNGTMRDYDRAGLNYAAAAKQNFPSGELLLGQLFETGRGTAVDLVKAYVLYSRAARSQLPAAVARRDAVKPQLSSAQLAEAERMLAEALKAAETPSAGGR